jgi:hypothetical protein
LALGFEILGEIDDVEVIARGATIREVDRLGRVYGSGRWRKLKGVATVRLGNRQVWRAEIHWYEAPGIGRKELKIKRFLDEP